MKYAKSVLCGMLLVSSVSIANATLVLYYDFEGDTLDNKASAATTHDGTVLLGSTVYSTDTPALVGGSASLNLTGNDLLQVNNSASGDSGYQPTFDSLSAMTMAFFMKTSISGASWDNFGNKGGDTGYQIRRFANLDRSRGGVTGGTNEITTPPGIVFNDDVWHHYAITWDGATLVYYVDGDSMGSLAIASMNDVPALPLLFGAQNTTGFRQTDGLYDEIRFYDNALTQPEIQALIPEPGHFAALFGALIVGAVLMRRRQKNND